MKSFKIFIYLILFSAVSLAQDGLIWKLDFHNTSLGPLLNYELTKEGGDMEYIYLANNSFVVEDEEHPNALRVRYPEGAVGPQTIGFSGSQFIKAIPESEDYYLDYYVKFEEGFDFQLGGKLPGLTSGGSQWTGGNHPDNGEGWSARYMWVDNGRMVVYLYYVDMNGEYGESVELGMNFVPGKWYRLTQRIKLNDVYTPGNGNGVLQVWVDGVQVIDQDDFRFRFEGKGMIDSFYFSTFFGGATADWAPDVDSYTRFDKIRVTTEKPDFSDPIDPPGDIVIQPNPKDATVYHEDVVIDDYKFLFCGSQGKAWGVTDAPATVVSVMPFKFPEVPEGKIVESAKLTVNVKMNDIAVNGYEIDVYALTARSDGDVLFSDFWQGTFGTDANATPIQKSIFAKDLPVNPNVHPVVSNPPVEIVMSTDGVDNLAAFMNEEYANGATSSEYFFIRFNGNDPAITGYNNVQIISMNDVESATIGPKLSVTFKDDPDLSNDKVDKQNISIYPNPIVNGEFIVSTVGMKNSIEMSIFSITGKLVNKQSLEALGNKMKVNVSLDKGLYIVRFYDGEVIKTQKITVQ